MQKPKSINIGLVITVATVGCGVVVDYVNTRRTVEDMKTALTSLAEATKPLVIDYQVKEELKKRGLWHSNTTVLPQPSIPPATLESITQEKTNAFNVSQFPPKN